MISWPFTAFLLVSLAIPAMAQSKKQAEQFVRMVYAHETVSLGGPFDYTQVMTPSLTALVVADRGQGRKIGKLDLDPLCACQDPDGLQPVIESLKIENKHATIAVVLRFRDRSRRRIALDLAWNKPDGWRINDVHTEDMSSLRSLLTAP